MSCGKDGRLGSILVLLWLWPVAVAPVLPLAWEFPYASGVPLKKQKKKKIANSFPRTVRQNSCSKYSLNEGIHLS